jgi:hypothetical protein
MERIELDEQTMQRLGITSSWSIAGYVPKSLLGVCISTR